MRIWFLAQQSGESGLSFRKLVRGGDDSEQFVVFGQKLRRKKLSCDDAAEGSVSCELPFRGRHAQHDYPLLERGTELSIRVVCEEHWSYEVRKTHIFCATFYTKNDCFTKTGSGQT